MEGGYVIRRVVEGGWFVWFVWMYDKGIFNEMDI